MNINRPQWQHFSSGRVIQVTPKGFPFMPGLALILLGLIIVAAPKFFLAAVSTILILMGAMLCYVAYKFLCLKKQLAKFAQDLNNSVEIKSFQVRHDDIDITESDTKKILFH